MIMSGLIITGIVIEATALKSFWQLVLGHIVVYSGISLASNCVPMYISETSPGWFFLPKLPCYLIYCSRFDKAEVVLRSLSNHPETVPQDIKFLKAQIEEQRENYAVVTVLYCIRGTNLRRTVIAMSVQILQ
ncbi:Putative major facilitator, sugar transporter, MFS transporter superfamily [Colletotrichum destructivum]|uniref:Major facilitator, sugar transporter, MFS transporter superfamily n=1 Tax=Colletotrichum destructivum TaxID=34406 RepID=A0AAX4J4A5_9PEZI|nr:Putative major facilitator, sugar transporter, MFS transporter superfamily [Colletotrichum destructivum]